jgi:protein-tyrosine-phosphatase
LNIISLWIQWGGYFPLRVVIVKILFICNANIVRSFMAERVLVSRLKRTGINGVKVSSAGLLDMHGAPADMMARQILRENGIEDEGHHSQVVNEVMIGEADLIVTMEMKQLQIIGDQYPQAIEKLRILKSYFPDPNYGKISGDRSGDIKDPYKKSIFYYRLCFSEISLAMEELMKCI